MECRPSRRLSRHSATQQDNLWLHAKAKAV